ENRATATDLLVALAIVAFVLVFFGRTLSEGQPLSRICNLADWDSLFTAYRSGTSTAIDPSLVQLLVPYHFLVANLWHGGQLPLWNPFNGCGVPLMADIQSGALSPFSFLLALCPTMYVYNVSLVLKVAVAALAVFGLARSLSLSRWASVFASLIFAFAPFCLWSLELITPGYWTHPVVYLCFVRAAQRPSLARSWLAGAACALLIFCDHPEVAFFGIAVA